MVRASLERYHGSCDANSLHGFQRSLSYLGPLEVALKI